MKRKRNYMPIRIGLSAVVVATAIGVISELKTYAGSPVELKNDPVCETETAQNTKAIAGVSLEIDKALSESMKQTVYTEYEVTPEDLAEEEYYDSLELLAIIVQAEAGNQSEYGKRLVIDVVLNRVDDSDFPDTIEAVLTQQDQFTTYWNGSVYTTIPGEDIYQLVTEELESRTNSEVLYFTSEGWGEYGTKWQKVGDHYFCTK